MAAGDAFSLTPTVVIPIEPDYYNIITPSESMKKEYLNMSATPVKRWTIRINVLTSAQMNTWLTHFNDNSGAYYKFTWNTVPSYVNSGANIDGRWVKGTWRASPLKGGYWSCEAVFEKDN
jgi:hypothetical protein